jgi:hypothetical protein
MLRGTGTLFTREHGHPTNPHHPSFFGKSWYFYGTFAYEKYFYEKYHSLSLNFYSERTGYDMSVTI